MRRSHTYFVSVLITNPLRGQYFCFIAHLKRNFFLLGSRKVRRQFLRELREKIVYHIEKFAIINSIININYMKNNIHVLSRGVIIDQDHILLAYDPRPHPDHYYEFNATFYYLPGGHIEFKESAHTALIREIKEETGFEARIEKFLGIIENTWSFPGDELCCHTHEMNFIFKLNVSDLKSGDAIVQKEEHVAFKWIAMNALKEVDLRPLVLQSALSEWLRYPENSSFKTTIK